MGRPKQSSIKRIPRDSRRTFVDVTGVVFSGVANFDCVVERKD
jgi:hypothetical protein